MPAAASTRTLHPDVPAVRRFNRFYTQKIGVLHEHLLHSPFSLAQVRVLYELAHRDRPTAAELGKDLGLDPGYLSRILGSFQRRGFLRRARSESDARQSLLALTAKGHAAFAPLEARQDQEVAAMLAALAPAARKRLVEAMSTVEELLHARPGATPYCLRSHQPGDMGWVVHRHGALYWQEYRYDERFEALVAEIVAEFIQNFDARRERCWIAERDGEIAGSVFLVKKSDAIAKLRLLLVEPSARGLGIGRRLVSECVRFARQVSYRKITLWTQSELHAARSLYRKAGFRLVNKHAHDSFGRKHLVAETWELKL